METPYETPAEIPVEETQEEEKSMTVEERLSLLSRQIADQMARSAQQEKQRRDQLDEREAALSRREMQSRTRKEMEKRGLPAALSECMAFADEAALEKGIAALEECFRAAVQASVEARLLDNAPKTTAMRPLHWWYMLTVRRVIFWLQTVCKLDRQ